MFLDELEKILMEIPYRVWEEVTDCKPVENVDVIRGVNWVKVWIRSENNEFYMDQFDRITKRHVKLLQSWRPYRELIERELNEYNRIMELPTNFIEPVAEKDFTEFMEKYCTDMFGWKDMLLYYIKIFGLIPFLKERCYKEKCDEVLSTDIKIEAFEMIFNIVKAELNGQSQSEVIEKYNLTDGDKVLSEARELADYCGNVINSCSSDSDVKLRAFLNTFLFQNRSINEINKLSDSAVTAAFRNCGEKERADCLAIEADKCIKRKAMSLLSFNKSDWFWNGYRWGIFERYVKNLYEGDKEILVKMLDAQKIDLVLEELIKKILDTKEEYLAEMSKSFEDYDMTLTEETDTDGKRVFVLKLPVFSITAVSENKDGAIKLAKEMLEVRQSEITIRRLLDITD